MAKRVNPQSNADKDKKQKDMHDRWPYPNNTQANIWANSLHEWVREPWHKEISKGGIEEEIPHISMEDWRTLRTDTSRQELDALIKSSPNLQKEVLDAKIIMASRRDRNVSQGKWPMGFNHVVVPVYDPQYKEGYEFHAALKAKSEIDVEAVVKELADLHANIAAGVYGPAMKMYVESKKEKNGSGDKDKAARIQAKDIPGTTL